MKSKICTLLFGVFFLLGSAQKAMTTAQLQSSTDMKAIAQYIKAHPDDPAVPALKLRLVNLLNSPSSASSPKKTGTTAAISGKTSSVYDTKQQKKALALVRRKESPQERILNHLINPDPNSNEALLTVENLSKCTLNLTVSGGKSYELNVGPSSKGQVLVTKGSYRLTGGSSCGKNYDNSVTLREDAKIILRG